MALRKTIRKDNGLPLSYHRISQLNIETNVRVGIWVRSYLDENERNIEKSEGEQVFHSDCYYSTEGPEGPMTVEAAYTWLKKNYPEFKDAEDC